MKTNDHVTNGSSGSFCVLCYHCSLLPFYTTGLFLYPLKAWESLRFSDVFRGYRKRPVAWNGLARNWTNLCLHEGINFDDNVVNQIYLRKLKWSKNHLNFRSVSNLKSQVVWKFHVSSEDDKSLEVHISVNFFPKQVRERFAFIEKLFYSWVFIRKPVSCIFSTLSNAWAVLHKACSSFTKSPS